MPPTDARPARRRCWIPRATYRIQLNAGFTFKDATAHRPLPRRPRHQPRLLLALLPGARRQHARLRRSRPQLPQPGDRQRARTSSEFVATLRAHQHGAHSRHRPEPRRHHGRRQRLVDGCARERRGLGLRRFFDIDWTPANPALAHKVLVPVLGDPYGVVLERGEIELRFEQEWGSFAVFYHEHRFPLDPRTYPRVLDRALAHVSNTTIENAAACLRRASRPASIPRRSRSPSATGTRRSTSAQLAAPVRRQRRPSPARFDAAVRSFARRPARGGQLRCPARAARAAGLSARLLARRRRRHQLPALLRRQRPCRAAGRERGGVRGHAPAGAGAGARRARSTACASIIPTDCTTRRSYFRRLQSACASPSRRRQHRRRCRSIWSSRRSPPPSSSLPPDWPVHGETGYHFANVVNRHARRRSHPDPHGSRLSVVHRRAPGVAGRRLRSAAPGAAPLARLRAQRRRQPAGAHRADRPQHARLHLQQPAPGARRSHRLLSGLPHVRQRQRLREDRRYIDWAIAAAKRAAPRPKRRCSTSCARRCWSSCPSTPS